MTRNGEQQDISVMPVNSQPIMVVQLGSGDNIELIRWGINTVIEYYTASTGIWNVGTVLSPNSVKDEKTQEAITLAANTPIRLRDTPTVSGTLVLSTKMYDIEYNADDLQTAYQFLYGSGIVRDKLYGNIFASGGRQITIQSAMFVIDGFVGFFRNPQTITLDVGDGSPRKDLLLLRKSQADGDVYLAIKRGIPSANPVAPTLTQNTNGIYEIALAEITVQANSTTIVQSDIKDVRETLFVRNIYSRPFVEDVIITVPAGATTISSTVNYTFKRRFQGTIRYYDTADPEAQIQLVYRTSQTQPPPGSSPPYVISDLYGNTGVELTLKSNKIPNWTNSEIMLSIYNFFNCKVNTASTVEIMYGVLLYGSRAWLDFGYQYQIEMPFSAAASFKIVNDGYNKSASFDIMPFMERRNIENYQNINLGGTNIASATSDLEIIKNEIPFTAEAGETVSFILRSSGNATVSLKIRIEGLEYIM